MFINLHVHSEYSLLDGLNSPSDLVLRAKELGQTALALTDHGYMYGYYDFYKTCKKHDIKPIIGNEIYFTYDIDISTDEYEEKGYDKRNYHLVLLAKNDVGLKNLIKLSSIAAIKGLYDGNPRIDLKYLEQYSEGIICSSACLGGIIPSRIIDWHTLSNSKEEYVKRRISAFRKKATKKVLDEFNSKEYNPDDILKEAYYYASEFKRIFGENFYLEIQTTIEPMQSIVNQKIIEITKELQIPLIVTTDAHYSKREEADMHDSIICLSTGKTKDDPNRMKYAPCYYLMDDDEVRLYLSYLPSDIVNEAIKNTYKIAESVEEYNIKNNKVVFPKIYTDNKTPEEYLNKLVYDKFFEYGLQNDIDVDLYKQRLDYELSVINKAGFAPYFLIVRDYIKMANDNNIITGPGRGSASGSLVTFFLGITKNLDPIKNGLLFERFLSPERIEMPDIDTDFLDEKRDLLIEMLHEKYGQENVAHIGTKQKYGLKNALLDAARVLNYDKKVINEYTKQLPSLKLDEVDTDEYDEEMSPQVVEILEKIKKEFADVYELALKLYGKIKTTGSHASGILITDKPIHEYIPLKIAEDSKGNKKVTTQLDMNEVAELGFIKFDILGLSTLSVINYAARLAGIDIDINNIKLDDKKAFELIRSGNTEGVFQVESKLFKSIISDMQPNRFEDLTALVALGRPGPLDSGMVESYNKRKKGIERIEYDFEELKDILQETYGLIIYQEDVMRAAQVLAGYSLGQADGLRKAIGKKKAELIAEHRKYFIDGKVDENGNVIIPGGVRLGHDREKLEQLYDKIEKFGSYGFNKSHAAAYALLTYITAYLKAYYQAEFMAATISYQDNIEDIGHYITHCLDINIEVLPPDINKSQVLCTVEDGKIRLGLAMIKGVSNAAQEIVEEREKNGIFTSFDNFYERVNKSRVNKTKFRALILSGVFESIDARDVHSLYNYYLSKGKVGDDEYINEPVTNKLIAQYQIELFGAKITKTTRFEKKNDGDTIQTTCYIKSVREVNDKRGRAMCFMTIENSEEEINCVVFAYTYKDIKNIIQESLQLGDKVVVIGKKDKKQIIVDKIKKAS